MCYFSAHLGLFSEAACQLSPAPALLWPQPCAVRICTLANLVTRTYADGCPKHERPWSRGISLAWCQLLSRSMQLVEGWGAKWRRARRTCWR